MKKQKAGQVGTVAKAGTEAGKAETSNTEHRTSNIEVPAMTTRGVSEMFTGAKLARTVVEIALDEIQAGEGNHRKFFDERALEELAQSISEIGVEEPITVRALPRWELRAPDLVSEAWGVVRVETDGTRVEESDWGTGPNAEALAMEEVRIKNLGAKYEIIKGERRWRASRMAGKATIPAMVRIVTQGELGALEIFNSCLIENMQREELSEVEEGLAFRRALDEKLHTVESLRKLAGYKSQATVFSRMKIAASPEPIRQALMSGALPGSIANYIVRIPGEKLQIRALKEVLEGGGYEQGGGGNKKCMSAREAQRHIEQNYTLDLKGAKFDPEDTALVTTAGACAVCPKRSGTDPEMFPDIKAPNVCTDPDCFRHKTDVWREMELEKARHQGLTVLTAKETKGVFSGAYLSNREAYVERDQTCYDDPKQRTYGELMGKKAPTPVVAVDGTGAIRQIYKREEVLPVLEKVVKLKPVAKEELNLAETTEERVKRLLKARVERETDIRLALDFIGQVESGKKEKQFLLWLLLHLLEGGDYDLDAALKRRGFTDAVEWRAEVRRMDAGTLAGLLAELHVQQYHGLMPEDTRYAPVDEGALESAEKEFKLDRKQVEKVVREEVKEEFRLPKDGEEIKADLALVEAACAVNSCADIEKAKGIVEFRGRRWICDGSGTGPTHAHATLFQVVPRAEYKGPCGTLEAMNKGNDGEIPYASIGVVTRCKGEEYVICGPDCQVRFDNEEPKKVSTAKNAKSTKKGKGKK